MIRREGQDHDVYAVPDHEDFRTGEGAQERAAAIQLPPILPPIRARSPTQFTSDFRSPDELERDTHWSHFHEHRMIYHLRPDQAEDENLASLNPAHAAHLLRRITQRISRQRHHEGEGDRGTNGTNGINGINGTNGTNGTND